MSEGGRTFAGGKGGGGGELTVSDLHHMTTAPYLLLVPPPLEMVQHLGEDTQRLTIDPYSSTSLDCVWYVLLG